MKRGYHVAIITGGRGRSLTVRFEMLGVEHVCTNCFHKIDALHELMQKLDVQAEEILYMGDDIPDIEPMLHVGMPVCPADAATEVVEVSRYVSQFKGGEGCVRDVVEQVMQCARRLVQTRRQGRSGDCRIEVIRFQTPGLLPVKKPDPFISRAG
ncbi:MAG: KdsC family phosphatase [Alistipes indistinctus]